MPRDGHAGARAEPIEGPWELPDGWRWERLGDLGTWFGGGTPSKANAAFWTGGTLPWVSPKDMKTAFIDDAEDHITSDALAASATRLVPADSVIFVMRSGILKHSLPVAVTRREVSLNQDLRALHPRPDVLPGFVAHYARRAAQSILHQCSKDGTTVGSIETGRLMNWPVPVPGVDVQRAIVARVDALFAEIDDGERALAEARAGVETYRKSLLKAAVTGELTADWRRANPPAETGQDLLRRILADRRARWDADPRNRGKRYIEPAAPDTGSLPDLPDEWCWAEIRQLTWLIRNGLSVKPTGDAGGSPILRISAVRPNLVDASDLRWLPPSVDTSGYWAQPGDLLVTRYSGSPKFVGVCGRYRA
ncbi:MAG TPA: restriction endonuclease subunit S [Acetobacteraceae bacterium]